MMCGMFHCTLRYIPYSPERPLLSLLPASWRKMVINFSGFSCILTGRFAVETHSNVLCVRVPLRIVHLILQPAVQGNAGHHSAALIDGPVTASWTGSVPSTWRSFTSRRERSEFLSHRLIIAHSRGKSDPPIKMSGFSHVK